MQLTERFQNAAVMGALTQFHFPRQTQPPALQLQENFRPISLQLMKLKQHSGRSLKCKENGNCFFDVFSLYFVS